MSLRARAGRNFRPVLRQRLRLRRLVGGDRAAEGRAAALRRRTRPAPFHAGGRRGVVHAARRRGGASARRVRGRFRSAPGSSSGPASRWPRLAPGAWTLALVGLGIGASNGLMDVTMNAHASGVERRWGSPIMSSFHAAFSVGGLAGAGFGAASLALGLGWRGLLIGLAAGGRRDGRRRSGEARVRASGRRRRRARSAGRRAR